MHALEVTPAAKGGDVVVQMDLETIVHRIPNFLKAAVALRPRRLIVAGIDLFSDPHGAYPGDDRTPNAYVLVHDGDLEREFIMRSLAGFDGELVIIGKVLAQHWRAFTEARQPQCAEPWR